MNPKHTPFAFAVAFTLGFITASFKVAVVNADCGNRIPAQVNETWLLNAQPPGGWYSPLFDEVLSESVTGVTNSTESMMDRAGTKKMCWTMKPIWHGVHAPYPIIYSCTYKDGDHVGDQICLLQNIQSTLKSEMFQLPSNIRLVIVHTDNSTYVAISLCLFGSMDMYAVLTTTKEGPGKEKMEVVKKHFESMGINVQSHYDKKSMDLEIKAERVKVDRCYEGSNVNELFASFKDLLNLGGDNS